MPDLAADLAAAVAAVRNHTDAVPDLALVLGSGLGGLADAAEDPVVVSTETIPGYPRSTVEGHAGRLVFGRIEGREVLVVQGRAHLYEGHPPRALGFPVRLAHALGARRLLLTNAAGSLNPDWPPGTLMLITDHIALAGASVLAGPVGEGEARFPDLSAPYDPAWMDLAEQIARNRNLTLRRGVYVWTAGPSYETPAEIRFFRTIGGDAVGMSTVPEAIQAAALGMKVLGLSTITNLAAGLQGTPLNHEEVLEVGQRVRTDLTVWVRDLIAATPPD
ncbi:MAG: purine-nucleoside phosphorylase [Rubricoccaceae bacterium]|nr:purine-nucleoside phosphorylase [Rubricoccaceae bacterium]